MNRTASQITTTFRAPRDGTYSFGIFISVPGLALLERGMKERTCASLTEPAVLRYPYDWTTHDPRGNRMSSRRRLVMPDLIVCAMHLFWQPRWMVVGEFGNRSLPRRDANVGETEHGNTTNSLASYEGSCATSPVLSDRTACRHKATARQPSSGVIGSGIPSRKARTKAASSSSNSNRSPACHPARIVTLSPNTVMPR
jgi:hypothetical protein